MSEMKSTISKVDAARTEANSGPGSDHSIRRSRINLPYRPPQELRGREQEDRPIEAASVSDFIAPTGETAEWLGNPAMTSVLAAVSEELAPNGSAATERDQYAASVVETHLVARRQLAKHLNALLRA